jgi:tetratricopeptide (TPR) repeat protein
MSRKRRKKRNKTKKYHIKNNVILIKALFSKATGYHQKGQYEQAEQLYRQVLALAPKHADSLHLLGLILADRGSLTQGLSLINQAIDCNPKFAAYYLNRGLIYKRLNQPNQAIEDYQRAVDIEPRMIEAYCNLGDSLFEQQRVDEAIDAYQSALKLNSRHRNACHNLGNAYLEKENYQQALVCYQNALAIQEGPETLSNIGVTLVGLNRIEEAIAYHQKAIQADPDFSKAYSNLGLALSQLNRLTEAEDCYRKALAIEPENAEFYSNLGVNYKDQGKVDKALNCFKKSLGIDPSSSKAQFNEAISLLIRGDFNNGWQKYESRFGLKERLHTDYHFSQPVWQGENFSDKTLFVYVEQGLGDTIQFIRYLPQVAERGGQIIFECQSKLIPLLKEQRHLKIDRIIPRGAPPPYFDYHIAIMSLPRIFNTTLETIPSKYAYIIPSSRKLNCIHQNNHKKVGIVWAGGKQHKNDRNRSIPLNYLEPLFANKHIDFYSLQYERYDEIQRYDNVFDLSAHINDFSDTAAIINELDLVISVDTSVAHLSGAIGKTTWILLPFAPDFRWLLDREDNPWYESARLFRQPNIGDWKSVIRRIKDELEKLVA